MKNGPRVGRCDQRVKQTAKFKAKPWGLDMADCLLGKLGAIAVGAVLALGRPLGAALAQTAPTSGHRRPPRRQRLLLQLRRRCRRAGLFIGQPATCPAHGQHWPQSGWQRRDPAGGADGGRSNQSVDESRRFSRPPAATPIRRNSVAGPGPEIRPRPDLRIRLQQHSDVADVRQPQGHHWHIGRPERYRFRPS